MKHSAVQPLLVYDFLKCITIMILTSYLITRQGKMYSNNPAKLYHKKIKTTCTNVIIH